MAIGLHNRSRKSKYRSLYRRIDKGRQWIEDGVEVFVSDKLHPSKQEGLVRRLMQSPSQLSLVLATDASKHGGHFLSWALSHLPWDNSALEILDERFKAGCFGFDFKP